MLQTAGWLWGVCLNLCLSPTKQEVASAASSVVVINKPSRYVPILQGLLDPKVREIPSAALGPHFLSSLLPLPSYCDSFCFPLVSLLWGTTVERLGQVGTALGQKKELSVTQLCFCRLPSCYLRTVDGQCCSRTEMRSEDLVTWGLAKSLKALGKTSWQRRG